MGNILELAGPPGRLGSWGNWEMDALTPRAFHTNDNGSITRQVPWPRNFGTKLLTIRETPPRNDVGSRMTRRSPPCPGLRCLVLH